jgi:hypothetical protein
MLDHRGAKWMGVLNSIGTALKYTKSLMRAVKRVPLTSNALWFSPAAPLEAKIGTERSTNPLREYFEAHNNGHGIWKFDHYLDLYHRHLKKFVGGPVTLLEIGIYSGGSLGMWRQYFGEQAKIWGIDIEPACAAYGDGAIEVFIGSQDDRAFLASINPAHGMDVVLDDGSHLSSHQIVSFEELFPRLKPGGVYICEDVHGIHNPFLDYVHGLNKSLCAMQPTKNKLSVPTTEFQRWCNSIHIYPYAVVIEKRERPLDALTAQKKGTLWQPFSPKAKTGSAVSV